MKTQKRLFVAIMVLSIGSIGCKKEKGCTVSEATNYNAEAEEDDGSCTYSSKIIFWQNQTNAAGWSSLGVTALNFYVNSEFIGSCAATEYNLSEPICTSNGQSNVTKSLGTSKSLGYGYKVKDQSGTVWYSGSIIANGTACTIQQID